jgi:hypothetical protein
MNNVINGMSRLSSRVNLCCCKKLQRSVSSKRPQTHQLLAVSSYRCITNRSTHTIYNRIVLLKALKATLQLLFSSGVLCHRVAS